MSRRERQLLEELLQAEVGRRLPELSALARDLHRRDWGRPQALRRMMRDISAFVRTSGFSLRTVAPHINDGFAGVATGRAPGHKVMLAAALGHGAVATAMAIGAAAALAALRLRWSGDVTVLVVPPGWQLESLNVEALALDEQTAAIGATIGRLDSATAPVTHRARATIVFHRPGAGAPGVGASGADGASAGAPGVGALGVDAPSAGAPSADALQMAVKAYQDATERIAALPHTQRLTAELHTRQASRRGVSLAELHLQLEALHHAGLDELVAYATALAERYGGIVAFEGRSAAELSASTPGDPRPAGVTPPAHAAESARAQPVSAIAPPVTAPALLWRKLGRQPAAAAGWDVIPHDLAALAPLVPVGVAAIGIGNAPGDPGFAEAVWGTPGERALRDGATLLAWHAAHILADGLPGHGRTDAAAAVEAIGT